MTPAETRKKAFAEIRRQKRIENLALLGLKIAALALTIGVLAVGAGYLAGFYLGT